MTGLYLLLPTLFVILVSFLVVRAGAIALMMTGVDQKRASFQALSAFTRTGFTTREAELVMNNPQRRRIVTWLIILGNAGLVAVIVSATSSVVTSEGYQVPITMLFIIAGLYLLYKLASWRGFIRRWEGFIERRFIKSHMLEEVATEDLLHLIEGYGLVRAIITENSPFVGSAVSDVRFLDKDIVILGIERGKEWIPHPRVNVTIDKSDKIVVYGHVNVLREIFKEEKET
ncbi:TrkA C-terminal domain-containing protein [Chloroflexota bacterium]